MRATGRLVVVAVLAAAAVTGCARTRVAVFGPLTDAEPLLTLIVSEDRDLVLRECASVATPDPVLGCHVSHPVRLAGGESARTIKIVRYTDSLPSAMAFEIDAHELCHAIAALQPAVGDPCHIGNGGRLSEHGTGLIGGGIGGTARRR